MIVSCESCKSRYKLDDAKVSGRGAKITCPKCKHVFVVYAPGTAAPASAPPRPTPSSSEEEEPTRVGLPTSPSRPSAPVQFGTAGGGPLVAAQGGGSLGGAVSPAVTPSRNNPTLAVPLPDPAAPDSHVVGTPPPPPPPAGVGGTVAPAEASARAAGLDFRKVGVPTWKVKVRIGLIYDFSDIKTLRKYITDGRVTPADVISYDGKSWKPIGDIPDLDTFFLDTYDRLMRERGAAEPPAPKLAEPVAGTGGATGDPRTGDPDPGLFRDPFDDLKNRQRERIAQKRTAAVTTPVKPAERSRAPALLVVLLLIGGGGFAAWKLMQPAPANPTPVTAPTAEVAKPLREPPVDKRPVWVPVESDTPPAPSTVPADPIANDPTVKVLPNGQVVRVVGPGGSSSASSGSGTSRPVSSGGTGSGTSSVKTTASSASDYEAIGDGAARNKDWANATRAYQDAVSAEPGSGRLLYKLGDAQYRAGQLDAASSTLQSAASRGYKDALKLAGAVAREQGDLSQANALYQQYLASGPKDAAEVERILKEMNGG